MAKRGGMKKEKSIASGKIRLLKRKEKTFTIKTSPGPHSSKQSIPLGFLIRNLLGFASNAREAKKILETGKIKVDGIARKELKFPVGLFDFVEVEGMKKNFRMTLDHKGRLIPKEIERKEKPFKLCRITGKRVVAGGKTQFNSNDGRSFLGEKINPKIGDSIKIELPSQKASEVIELKKGNLGFVTRGKHAGSIAKIIEVIEGTEKREKLVELEHNRKKFITVEKNVFVIGEKKPEIEVLGEGKE